VYDGTVVVKTDGQDRQEGAAIIVRGSQTLDRGLHVLDVMTESRRPLRLSEIAEASDLNISTASRMLRSLESRGFVRRDRISGHFRLGYKILYMANIVIEQAGLHQIANSTLEDLVRDTQETATLNVLLEDAAMIVVQIPSGNQLQVMAPVGSRWPLYCTAAGKTLLAFQPDERITAYLSRTLPSRTPLTITSPEALRAELAAIRERGWGCDHGECEEGLAGVAAPVRDLWGAAIASSAISGSISLITESRLHVLANQVRDAAFELSRRIGWQGSAAGGFDQGSASG
jgi:IclR family acetate operon transcriptional repressor